MRIPYCFLDQDYFPSDEPWFFEDEPGSGRYVIIQAQTMNTANGYTFLRSGEDVEEAQHNLWEALWAVFARLPNRPDIPCPPEENWIPSDNPNNYIEFDR